MLFSRNTARRAFVTSLVMTLIGLGAISGPASADAVRHVSVSDTSVLEGTGSSVNAVVTVSLDAAAQVATNVGYSTADGSATAGTDYTSSTGVVSFTAGSTSKTISIPVSGDTRYEGDEYFSVNIFAVGDPALSISDSQAYVKVVDDERAPYISAGKTSVLEGDSGTAGAIVPLSLNSPSANTIKVKYYTSNSSALAGEDYTYTQGTATFAPGTTSVNVAVPVKGDTKSETDEDFTLSLYGASGATITPGAYGRVVIRNDDATTYLSIEDARVAEGNSGTTNAPFVVRLTHPATQNVKASFSTSDGSATVANNDYQSQNIVVTIPAGSTSATVNVPVVGDATNEGASEYFSASIGAISGASVLNSSATGYIIGDDPSLSAVAPTISISDASVVEPDAGTTSASLTLRLSNTSASNVTVNYATSDNTAQTPGDYTPTAGTATIPAGSLTTTIPVTVKGDVLDEADETVTVTLSAPTVATLSDATASLVLRDNDTDPGLWISDTAVVEGAAGTTNAVFNVNLTGTSAQTISVNYATADSGATAPSDYTAGAGTVTFAPGETLKTITVPVKGDGIVEGNEEFYVSLSGQVNTSLLDSDAYGVILNDDASPVFSVADVNAYEGQTATTSAKFTVKLSASSTLPVTVDYVTSDGSATAPSDYAAASGTLTFAPGVVTQTVSVTVKGDTINEGDEYLYLSLSNELNAEIWDATAQATIVDDDIDPTISLTDVQVNEGNSGTTNASVPVTLTSASSNTVTVDYTVSDYYATVADNDFVAASGTLTFTPGQTSKTVAVVVNGDNQLEGDESVLVTLGNATNASLYKTQAWVIIVNDDKTSYLSVNDPSVVEANSGTNTVTFDVSLNSASSAPVTVDYTTGDSSAVAPGDYTVKSGTLTFNPGVTTQQVAVTVKGETVNEPDEQFVLYLSNPQGAALHAQTYGYATILDNDPDKPGSYVSIGNAVVNEGDSGTTTANIPVTLFPAATVPVTVNYTTGDYNATADTDYVGDAGTVTFAPGQTAQTISVLVNGDKVDEADELFQVNLSGVNNATTVENTGWVYVRDDDTAPWVSVSSVQVVEGNSGQTLATATVSLTAPASVPTPVDWQTANGNAVADHDYLADSDTLQFGVGEQTKTVSVVVLPDMLNEGDEYFQISATGGNTQGLGQTGYGHVVISDADTFKISGTMTDGSGAPLAGVTMTATGNNLPAAATTTSATGTWAIEVPDGSYTVTPTLAAHKFLPSTATALVRGADVTANLAFVGLAGNAIGGRITNAAGVAVAGVLITRSGNAQPNATATSNATGYYGFDNSPAGTYTLTATKASTTFNPTTFSVTASAAGSLKNDFVALTGVTITGRVTVLSTGAGLTGVTVTRTGGAQPTVVVKTNSQGYYGFSNVFGVSGGTTYTITPTLTATVFTPLSRSAVVTDVVGASGQDFTK